MVEETETNIDWDEAPLQRWLGTKTKSGTKYVYKSVFKKYSHFTGMTATQLIDEAIEDSRRDVRDRKEIVLSHLVDFYNYLKTEYSRNSRGAGKRHVQCKGLSDNMANLNIGAIRSFYGTYDIVVRLKGRRRLPKPKTQNKRMIVGSSEVKVLVNNARTPRDGL
ncbi:MAG: hypothetical protein V1850_04820 [Candidatus Bathyarchaeota archaeon]